MLKNRLTFFLIYAFGFLWSLSMALPSYVQSSFLQQFVKIEFVGLYIILATIVTLIFLFFFPHIIKRFRNYHTSLFLIGLGIIAAASLAFANSWWLVLIFFIFHFLSLNVIAINLDIFLEGISDDKHTGNIRTTFLTIANSAWVIAPLIMGYLAQGDRYSLIYLASAAVLVPVLIILMFTGHNMKDRVNYKNRSPKQLISFLFKHKNVRNILKVTFLLRFFYCIMVLYTPIYLHEYIGFSWSEIGVIFTVMLLPFVILQLPAGNLADRYFGEKEILIFGLVIMLTATGSIFFIQSTSLMVWMAILFMTRVGASLVEAMQDVYFFKQIDRQDMDLIDLYRNTRPMAWLVGALFAVVILEFFPIQYLLLFLAVIISVGLRPALMLKDTK